MYISIFIGTIEIVIGWISFINEIKSDMSNLPDLVRGSSRLMREINAISWTEYEGALMDKYGPDWKDETGPFFDKVEAFLCLSLWPLHDWVSMRPYEIGYQTIKDNHCTSPVHKKDATHYGIYLRNPDMTVTWVKDYLITDYNEALDFIQSFKDRVHIETI